MEAGLVDGQILKEMFTSGTAWLEKSVPDINAINVFPVPDGDTGTNMLLTMRAALEEATENSDRDASSVAKSLSHGSLMGARGNSGVILSQFWRGLAKGLSGKDSFGGKDFAKALAEASQAAYEGIVRPVEGTMLTVLKDAAEAADKAAKAEPNGLVSVLEAAVAAARDSVARTPNLLPVLKEAGVVDAGGQGVYVLLDGAFHFLKGEGDKIQYWRPQVVATDLPLAPRTTPTVTEVEVSYGYCTNFVLKGQKLGLKKIKRGLKKKGQSLVVTGDNTTVRVHIHSSNPGEILNYASRLGTLHHIEINNMTDQYAEFIRLQKERLPAVDIAIVTVAIGDGFVNVFNSLGSAIVVPGGQTMNPSVRQLVQAVELAPSNNIILLPNNKNIIPTVSQVEKLTSKEVRVIPSRTIPQGIAAFLAFTYDMDLDENARVMEEAIRGVRTLAITKAIRNVHLDGLEIKKGYFIAILDDEALIASGDNTSDVILKALEKTDIANVEMITIYYGAEAEDAEAENVAKEIREKYPIEVEVLCGGQPYYNYVISLE
ncbi:MAG: DAK2 domain-containing protein [Dehalococcoidia bacterium]|nr:MAG: DAK2 domain-containing protein [Dehalococcoidia bacterium]